MADWKTMNSAPKDGRFVRLRRVVDGETLFEGDGYWGLAIPGAPMRTAITPKQFFGSNSHIAPDHRASEAQWMRDGGLYRFPEPTHWKPASTET